ncbi:hypothetical protein BDM02DRAFT_3263928 [Thelephora ganbajun]|uniref:Uncharacterized protein n=1 Tax=Thelephora ganbajun TaxID=370292 RepID=A0ACB6Z1Z8_THEGA|nr:hypothetical protein BDM02DRAFT_3263928 [Thelephora ganbajun]
MEQGQLELALQILGTAEEVAMEAVGKYSEIAEVLRSVPVLTVRPKRVDETSLARSAPKSAELQLIIPVLPPWSVLANLHNGLHGQKNANENTDSRSGSTGDNALQEHADALPWFVYLCRIASGFAEVFEICGGFTETNRQHAIAQNLAVYSPDDLRNEDEVPVRQKAQETTQTIPKHVSPGIPAKIAAESLGF